VFCNHGMKVMRYERSFILKMYRGPFIKTCKTIRSKRKKKKRSSLLLENFCNLVKKQPNLLVREASQVRSPKEVRILK
jgi:hypothetical protein